VIGAVHPHVEVYVELPSFSIDGQPRGALCHVNGLWPTS